MANIASQIKRNRQSESARKRNVTTRSQMKTKTRAVLAAAESGDADAAREALRQAQQKIDSAAAKGVLHKKTAARRKARLHRRVQELLG